VNVKLSPFLTSIKDVTYHSCATCGTTMWVDAAAMDGLKIVKTGTIDDQNVLDNAKPVQEIYCKDRAACFAELPGVDHKDAA
jgi:hypothetical protein